MSSSGVLPPEVRNQLLHTLKPWALSIILFPACVYFLWSRGDYTFLDSADLIIHEAGHFFFHFFGFFVGLAGGTLMQILLPSLLVWHFARNDYLPGTQLCLFWLGHNFINISVYAADARTRQLPLLGGDSVLHDWGTMLSMLNMLEYDQIIGWTYVGLAVLAFVACLVAPRYL